MKTQPHSGTREKRTQSSRGSGRLQKAKPLVCACVLAQFLFFLLYKLLARSFFFLFFHPSFPSVFSLSSMNRMPESFLPSLPSSLSTRQAGARSLETLSCEGCAAGGVQPQSRSCWTPGPLLCSVVTALSLEQPLSLRPWPHREGSGGWAVSQSVARSRTAEESQWPRPSARRRCSADRYAPESSPGMRRVPET